MLLWLCYKDVCFSTPFFLLPKLDNTKKDNSEILTVRANKIEDRLISRMHVLLKWLQFYLFIQARKSKREGADPRFLSRQINLERIGPENYSTKSQF